MITPVCKYFGECGGCTAQHIEYSLQLQNKAKRVCAATGFKDVNIFHENEFFYRNRMDFLFCQGGLGLRKKNGGVIAVEECAISNRAVNRLLAEVSYFSKSADAFDAKKKTGTFKEAVIRAPGEDSCISFVLNPESARIAEAVEKIKAFAGSTSAKNVLVSYDSGEGVSDSFVVKGSEFLSESCMGKKFLHPAQGFFQNNSEVAEKMQSYCHELLKKYETRKACLLDLYGGVGCFGIANCELFKEVLIVESEEGSIKAAEKNIELNSAKNCKAVLLDAKKIRKLSLGKPLFVITDPPRSGMHQATIRQLNELQPEAIIYISCNPQQLSRELPKFKEYEAKSVAMFDMFPQTLHIETVVELMRTS